MLHGRIFKYIILLASSILLLLKHSKNFFNTLVAVLVQFYLVVFALFLPIKSFAEKKLFEFGGWIGCISFIMTSDIHEKR
jgi:hypothetical protein